MKITAHMKDGQTIVWNNLAEVMLLTTNWARLGERSDDWTVGAKDQPLGSVMLLNINEMVYWVQEWDDLDDVENNRSSKSWLEPPPTEVT